jgi:hypothetical protein
MYDDPEDDEALVLAFTEFRSAVDQLIDEQIARLSELPDESSLLANNSPAANLPVAGSGSERRLGAAAPGSPASIPISRVTIRSAPADRRPHSLPAAKRSATKPVVLDAAKANGVERDDDDPKQRLDALARHLDDRLRRARDQGGDRPKQPGDA